MMSGYISKFYLLVFLCLTTAFCFSQAINQKSDSSEVNLLLKTGLRHTRTGNDSSFVLAKAALKLSQQINYQEGITESYNLLGKCYADTGNYNDAFKNHQFALKLKEQMLDDAIKKGDLELIKKCKKTISSSLYNLAGIEYAKGNFNEALKKYFIVLKLREEVGENKLIRASYNSIANTYDYLGNFPEALNYYFKALKLSELDNDEKGMAMAHIGLAAVYYNQGNLNSAIEHNVLALKYAANIGAKQGMSICYNNMGSIYAHKKEYDKALEYLTKAYEIMENAGDLDGMATCLNNMGGIYTSQNNHDAAILKYNQALKVRENIGDLHGQAQTYNWIGRHYLEVNQAAKGKEYLEKALGLAKETESKQEEQIALLHLSEAYEKLHDFKLSLENYKLYIASKDSTNNEENTKKSVRLEMNFDFEKKEAATKLEQEKKEAIANAESKKQKIIIWSICGILILVIAFAIFAYKSFLQKQKANKAISKQKEIIEHKQKEILDSIHYAKRIQSAMLTSEKYIQKNLDRLSRKK